MQKKIKSLRYPEMRDIYKHPETKEEFEELLVQMIKANNIGDCTGVFTIAMNLIPRVIETETVLERQDLSEEESFCIKVGEFLEDNSERAHTPAEIGKALGMSALDMWNPLMTLIKKRLVNRTGKYYMWVK